MEENNKIEQLNKEAEEILGQIKIKKSDVDTLFGEITTIVESVKTSTDQTKKGLETKIVDLDTKITTIATKEGSVDTLLQQAQTKTSEIEVLNQKLLDLKTKIEDPASGVDAVITKINADNQVTSEKSAEAGKLVETITQLEKTAKTLDGQIKTNKEQIEGYKKEIEIMYGFITGSGLSHSFSERQVKLEERVIFWQRVTFVSVLVLCGILLFLLLNKNLFTPDTFWAEAFLYKASYSAPGIFLVWFSALQYSRAQRLMESYAFKAATAKALENYTEVLERRFNAPEYKKEILGFVLSSMQEIYKHPNGDLVSHEDKKVEENAMVNLDSTLKKLGENVLDPINGFLEKIKKVKE